MSGSQYKVEAKNLLNPTSSLPGPFFLELSARRGVYKLRTLTKHVSSLNGADQSRSENSNSKWSRAFIARNAVTEATGDWSWAGWRREELEPGRQWNMERPGWIWHEQWMRPAEQEDRPGDNQRYWMDLLRGDGETAFHTGTAWEETRARAGKAQRREK